MESHPLGCFSRHQNYHYDAKGVLPSVFVQGGWVRILPCIRSGDGTTVWSTHKGPDSGLAGESRAIISIFRSTNSEPVFELTIDGRNCKGVGVGFAAGSIVHKLYPLKIRRRKDRSVEATFAS